MKYPKHLATLLLVGIVGGCYAVSSQSSFAQLSVYEPWDLGLADGASATGLGGSTAFGFSQSGWNFTGNFATGTYDSAGLSYTDIDGNSLNSAPGAFSIASVAAETNLQRSLSVPLDDRPGEYYVSYLLRLDSAQAGDGFWSSDGSWDKGAVGFQGSNNLRFVNGSSSGVTASQGETHLLVVRINRDDDDGTPGDGDSDFAQLWVDPSLTFPGSPNATFQTDNNANNRIRDATSALFKFNAQNSAAYTIDELRIGNTFADVTPFVGQPTLMLEVDTVYGEVRLINDSAEDYQIASYEISSALNTLRPAGFVPLEVQDRTDLPAGDGSGNGWEVAGNPSIGFISEHYLTGSSQLSAGVGLTLGTIYDTTKDARDLSIELLVDDGSPAGTILPVLVQYTSGTNRPGDYDEDQEVDGADFLSIQRDAGMMGEGLPADWNLDGTVNSPDILVWGVNYGSSGTTSIASSTLAVPEPATAGLVLTALGVCLARRKFGAR